jgi:hypothetical protein
MSNGRGWIKLPRCLAAHDDQIWNSPEPFDARSARIDLLIMARFTRSVVMTPQGSVTLGRGEFLASTRWLARRWRWSNDRVTRFLRRLVADGFIAR